MENRGGILLQELRDAIEGSERVIAVIGPQALSSDDVRIQQEHAVLLCKAVVSVLRIGDQDAVLAQPCVADRWSAPMDLRKFHAPARRACLRGGPA